jgi:hypothetical protein
VVAVPPEPLTVVAEPVIDLGAGVASVDALEAARLGGSSQRDRRCQGQRDLGHPSYLLSKHLVLPLKIMRWPINQPAPTRVNRRGG